MTARLDRPATQEGLFLWVMHRFSEVFEEHAILKGGMALRLLDCPRRTMDIDYVFVPFDSKKEIVDRVGEVIREIEGASVDVDLHSKMLRADLRVDDAVIQIEANVAAQCESIPMTTGGFAQSVGHPSQIVRIMSLPHALSHKIAAWNERRLFRDLYDCYFLFGRADARPNLEVLDRRLSRVQSRLPQFRKRRRMSRVEFAKDLCNIADELDDPGLEGELAGILPPEELAGLAVRIRAAVKKLADIIIRE
jgi:hypothetical protein